ncbi:hypothetical protein ACIGZH_01590 [Streptomyces sp. NPDC058319]|uniref:hypothetical protein n=1 Tax=unclassified Streptomyces TaxID=2593676 RepID=UPI0036E81B3C
MILTWYGCDLRTGGIIEELPSLTPQGALTRRLGTSTSTSVALAMAGAPTDWEAATAPGRSLLVAVDTEIDRPIWAGIPLPREGGSAPEVTFSAATPEAYLDRRYTGTRIMVQQDQATVVTALMTEPLTQGPPFVMDAPPTGVLMDYQVQDSDDRTVLSVLEEISGAEGGPEWTIDVEWADAARTGFVLPVRVRPTIGVQAAAPEAVFDFPGCITSYSLAESYEAGKGATVVLARGDGEGAARLSSAPAVATALEAAGQPRYEYRFTPGAGLTDPDQLNAHAAKALALMQTGSAVWTVQAAVPAAPRLGRDWSLGDTVQVSVTRSPRHPAGAEVVARAWSWELEPGTDVLRPILVEED